MSSNLNGILDFKDPYHDYLVNSFAFASVYFYTLNPKPFPYSSMIMFSNIGIKKKISNRVPFGLLAAASLFVSCSEKEKAPGVETSAETQVESPIEPVKKSLEIAEISNMTFVLRNNIGEPVLTLEVDDKASGGSKLDLTIEGKKTSLNVKSFKSADKATWVNRRLADFVPFKAQQFYRNFDDDATAVINSLGIGLNVGQSWEGMLPKHFMPGAYRNVYTTRELFRRIKKAGFDHVRIPVNFSNHTAIVAPWTIDSDYLDRYFANVDEALAEGLLVIVDNHHHTGYLNKLNAKNRRGGKLPREEQKARQAAMVAHVAKRLNDYPFEKVLFELENEPNGTFNKDWNTYWPGMLKGCRAVNAKTIFLIGGTHYNSPYKLEAMPEIIDRRTALIAHVYEPHSFTHNNKRGGAPVLWTPEAKEEMEKAFDIVAAQVALRGKPCVISEIGAGGIVSNHHRNMYARDAANACMSRGLPLSYWNAYGDFGIFRPSGDFGKGISEAITGRDKASDYAIPQTPGSNAIALSKCLFGAYTDPLVSVTPATISFNETPELQFTDTTITIMSDPVKNALVLPYVLMKGGRSDAPRDGRKFSVTMVSTNKKTTFKLSLTDMQALVNIQGYIPFPKGASKTSNPKWGDHHSGTYEYECYSKPEAKSYLKYTAPLGFVFGAANVKRGDVITFKIEWLD